jgi:hypothetical protein
VMEYLTQVTGVHITLTQDASKKEILIVQQLHSKSNLLLLLRVTKQDRGER